MEQLSLGIGTPPIGHNNPPKEAPIKRKVIEVTKVPSISMLQTHAWGASYRVADLDDKALVKAWTYSHVANWMQRFSVTPRGFVHRRHHHIRPQIADMSRIALIDAEMTRRGLKDQYELDISLGHVFSNPVGKR